MGLSDPHWENGNKNVCPSYFTKFFKITWNMTREGVYFVKHIVSFMINLIKRAVPSKFLQGKGEGWSLCFEAFSSYLGSIGSKDEPWITRLL